MNARLETRVSEVLSPKVEIALPEATLTKAALKMRTSDVGFLPVCEDRRVVGIVTDRDIVVRAIAEGRDPDRTRVEEVMSSDPICCNEDDTLGEALELMRREKVRRLPVVTAARKLIGVLSLGDVASRGAEEAPVQEALAEIREPEPVSARRQTSERREAERGSER